VSEARLASPIRAAVVTLSDKASAGLRADASGPLLVELLAGMGAVTRDAVVIPDDQPTIERTLIELADSGAIDLILTTGGTGLAPRDCTPEATLAVADRVAPGFAEAMRAASLAVTPHAMLSRAVSAVRKKTLIINMPGSPRACREHFAVVAPVLEHAVETLRGEAFECATVRPAGPASPDS
jgi:molybdopterin adenylyltransferase